MASRSRHPGVSGAGGLAAAAGLAPARRGSRRSGAWALRGATEARSRSARSRKESSWRCRVVVGCDGVEEGGCGGEPMGGGVGGVSVLGQDRADLADDVADGAAADVEQVGQGVLAA